MVTVTFIRHGQSEDNCCDVWAGWKDAPLTNYGQRQAQALGQSLAKTKFTHVYSSDLLRAHSTAQAVLAHQLEPKPPLTVTKLVREQHFGVAEGNKWMLLIPDGTTREELQRENIYPVYRTRHEKYDSGESLDDLAQRAENAIKECVLPHLDTDAHIAITSHGLCISEMVSALVRLDPKADTAASYHGLLNTAWTRLEIQREANNDSDPVLDVIVSVVNHADHLSGLEYDSPIEETASEARAFFGGGGDTTSATMVEIEKGSAFEKSLY